MKRDKVIEFALKAGLLKISDNPDQEYFIPSHALFEELEYFAAMVAIQEREKYTIEIEVQKEIAEIWRKKTHELISNSVRR